MTKDLESFKKKNRVLHEEIKSFENIILRVLDVLVINNEKTKFMGHVTVNSLCLTLLEKSKIIQKEFTKLKEERNEVFNKLYSKEKKLDSLKKDIR